MIINDMTVHAQIIMNDPEIVLVIAFKISITLDILNFVTFQCFLSEILQEFCKCVPVWV
jgi:hypothetical protein